MLCLPTSGEENVIIEYQTILNYFKYQNLSLQILNSAVIPERVYLSFGGEGWSSKQKLSSTLFVLFQRLSSYSKFIFHKSLIINGL